VKIPIGNVVPAIAQDFDIGEERDGEINEFLVDEIPVGMIDPALVVRLALPPQKEPIDVFTSADTDESQVEDAAFQDVGVIGQEAVLRVIIIQVWCQENVSRFEPPVYVEEAMGDQDVRIEVQEAGYGLLIKEIFE
jgi:hypothetical protein